MMSQQKDNVFLTIGSRADKSRGDYQERAAADSGDETESQSSVWSCVCCD